jgi:hypothetical protein
MVVGTMKSMMPSTGGWRLVPTPGGLRGGGAVAFYSKGGTVSELLWAMRLKQIATLESYLQEVAALSFLKELSTHSLASIRAAASLFPHLDC